MGGHDAAFKVTIEVAGRAGGRAILRGRKETVGKKTLASLSLIKHVSKMQSFLLFLQEFFLQMVCSFVHLPRLTPGKRCQQMPARYDLADYDTLFVLV